MTRSPRIGPVFEVTPERIAAVRNLVERGLSRTAIAQRFGVTKGVICGLVNRHIKGRQYEHRRQRVSRPRKSYERHALSEPPPPLPVALVVLPPPAPKPVQLPPKRLELPSPRRMVRCTSCQYVTTEQRPYRYCEAPTDPGSVYCPAHHRLCRAAA